MEDFKIFLTIVIMIITFFEKRKEERNFLNFLRMLKI